MSRPIYLTLALAACSSSGLSPAARRLAATAPAVLPALEVVHHPGASVSGTAVAVQCLASGAVAADAEQAYVEADDSNAPAASALLEHRARACVLACDDAYEHRAVSDAQRMVVQRFRSGCIAQITPAHRNTLGVERELAAARLASQNRRWLAAHAHLGHVDRLLFEHPIVRAAEYRAQLEAIRSHYGPGLRWADQYLTDPHTQKLRRRFEQLEREESELLAAMERWRARAACPADDAACLVAKTRQAELITRLGQVQSELANLHSERAANQQLALRDDAGFVR